MTLKISCATQHLLRLQSRAYYFYTLRFVFHIENLLSNFRPKTFALLFFFSIFEGKYQVHSFEGGDREEPGGSMDRPGVGVILMCYNIQWVEIQFRRTNGMLNRCKSDFIQFSLHLFVCLFAAYCILSFCLRTVDDIVVNSTFNHHIANSSLLEMGKRAR